jgi:hypothetical protein
VRAVVRSTYHVVMRRQVHVLQSRVWPLVLRIDVSRVGRIPFDVVGELDGRIVEFAHVVEDVVLSQEARMALMFTRCSIMTKRRRRKRVGHDEIVRSACIGACVSKLDFVQNKTCKKNTQFSLYSNTELSYRSRSEILPSLEREHLSRKTYTQRRTVSTRKR